MATPMKDSLGPEVVHWLGDRLAGAHPGLDRRCFVAEGMAGLDGLELMARGRHLASVMARHLPDDPADAVGVVIASLEPVEPRPAGLAALRYLPLVEFVGTVGLAAFEESMVAQRELTRRFTAEFSIRPFLVHHRDRTLQRLRDWTDDPDEHVRRLVSEGTRPRLPWAPRLPEFIADPRPVLGLLELLRDDPSDYVRRSVANNLNDISKDHPQLAVDVAARWWADGDRDRRRLVRHGLRTLVKRADGGALAVLGLEPDDLLQITASRVAPQRPRIGDRLQIAVDVADARATGPRRDVAVDVVVHFARPRGVTSARVFKAGVRALAPGDSATFACSVSLAQHSTRTHHPGAHRIQAQVNGVRHDVAVVELAAGP